MRIKKPYYFEFKKAYRPYCATIPIKVKAGKLIIESVIRHAKKKNIVKIKSITIINNLITNIHTFL